MRIRLIREGLYDSTFRFYFRDVILHKVKANRGIVMVNFYNTYVNCDPEPTNETTIRNIVRHIEYIKNLIGVEYVGMGSDYDGVPAVPKGNLVVDVTTQLAQNVVLTFK